MENEPQYAFAVKLLQGTDGNYILCSASMAASLMLAAAGIIVMTDDAVKRVMSAQSIIFLVAQSFTLTRVSRDRSTFSASDIARPTLAYFIQVMVFLLAAVVMSVYSVITSATVTEWRGFYVMSLLWATVSALCLSKAVRDRSDAKIFLNLPAEERQARLPQILRICRGTLEYKVLVWMSAVVSVILMLGIMWSWDAETLVIERKGFISVCLLWCQVSAFHLAKLVRDRADPQKSPELGKQLPFQVLVVLSAITSSCILIVGLSLMPLLEGKRFCMLAGSGFAFSSALFLAKHVRDRVELRSDAAALAQPGACVQAAVVVQPV
jgi:hypothetical protein